MWPLLWHYVLGWGIDNVAADSHGGYNVSYTDLPDLPLPVPATPTMVAWPEYLDGQPQFSQLREFPTGANDPGLHIPKNERKGAGYGEYTLWRTAPILCSQPGEIRVALLGESAKFISVSAQRIASFVSPQKRPPLLVRDLWI